MVNPRNLNHILVVDDDPLTRTLVTGIVKKDGYDVISAPNGREAWEIIQSNLCPAVAIVDWMMPEMNGIELCKLIRQTPHIPYIYIILLTSQQTSSDVVQGLSSGADDFIKKPAHPDELRSRIAVGIRTVHYENTLKETNRQLAIFQEAFNSCIQEMFITNPDGAIMYANPASADKYGFELPELIGKDIHTLSETREGYTELGIPPQEYDRIIKNLSEQVRSPNQGIWRGMVLNRTKEGRTIWADLIVSAIRGEDTAPIAFVSVPVDITERTRQEFLVRLECYRAMSALAEARDNETGQHLKRLSEYALLLAKTLGKPRKFCEDMGHFAPLHDIGKVGIPDHILLAPRKLDESEFDIMKSHTEIGYRILRDRPTLEMAADIAYTHHERFDGSGYPRGLAGEDIPLCGRLIAIVDVYDALRSTRPYKPGWPHEKAVNLIRESAGTHFDPQIVQAFMDTAPQMQEIFDQSDEEEISARP